MRKPWPPTVDEKKPISRIWLRYHARQLRDASASLYHLLHLTEGRQTAHSLKLTELALKRVQRHAAHLRRPSCK